MTARVCVGGDVFFLGGGDVASTYLCNPGPSSFSRWQVIGVFKHWIESYPYHFETKVRNGDCVCKRVFARVWATLTLTPILCPDGSRVSKRR